ncbi:MAG TPA: PH domain-containing protein [Thermoplasmata archaeon]|jgi:membrane protein YdbS with pleckstrin-like domain|nr:PH domain-containing protein [Thermoplasmata archaeon]
MSATVRTMPKLLKATFLADQEALLEETRATKLFYFPGPVLWTVISGFLALVSAPAISSSVPTVWADGRTWLTLSNYLSADVQRYLAYFWLLLFLLGLLWLLIRYFRWITTVYAVTSRRVIVQRGILGKDFDEIPVNQVRGVDVRQTFGERILGYGTVRVSSEGGSRLGNEDWQGIPRPFRFQKLIENATINQQTTTGPVQWAGPGR